MSHTVHITRQRLPEFTLTPTDYGWEGSFPGEVHKLFDQEVHVKIDTRTVPDDPEILPPVSVNQAELVRLITSNLNAILKQVHEVMLKYNDYDPDFAEFVEDPHVWLDSERDNGESWTFVIERSDSPDFGYHVEFIGTDFVEIWAGD